MHAQHNCIHLVLDTSVILLSYGFLLIYKLLTYLLLQPTPKAVKSYA